MVAVYPVTQTSLNTGSQVERRNFDDVTHEFLGMAAVVATAREAQAWAGDRLLEAFASA